MDRAQKQEAIETLKGVFDGAGAVVVTHYLGLTVAEMTDLRGRLRNEGAQLKVVKNTLVQKALNGSVGEAGDALFKGPVAIAYAPDPVSAAKVATQYAKDNEKFTVVGGLMGQTGAGPGVDQGSREPAVAGPAPRPRSSASSRRPRPRSPASCRLRPVSWLASSAPTPPKTPPDRHFRKQPSSIQRTKLTWLISTPSWTNCPS